ncbi:MAG: threonine synthase [Candidatus Sumerlaeia bacterium]|nr:threonine synthase [Candidatus Sumerlaeia bacterium]
MTTAIATAAGTRPWPGLIQAYRPHLPVSERTPIVTLHEGNTPLVPAPGLSRCIDPAGRVQVLLKFDGANPTGSFKDRGMTMAMSKALEEGKRAVVCASTGNTSASAAAYAARAGMQCVVLIPKGNIALGKLSQAMLYGAEVFEVEGNFDDCLRLVVEMGESLPVEIVNSINPYRIQGQKTAAFEIIDQLGGEPPDFQFMPVGNAGNITAYWLGYSEAAADGRVSRRPVMCGFQAAGANPIVRGAPVEKPETIATAIRIGNPASWKQAVAARDESGGIIEDVTDEEILEQYKWTARTEGLIAEPASLAGVAGLVKVAKRGFFEARLSGRSPSHPLRIVCILTGHGLKDPERAIKCATAPTTVPADLKEVAKRLRLG